VNTGPLPFFQGQPEIRGIVFDCDGTLADSMPLHWKAWQTVTQRYRLYFPEERFYSLGGVPSRDILKMLGNEQGISIDPLAASREKESAYLEMLSHVAPIQAVVSIAHAYHGKIPMAVASGGSKPVILKVLKHLSLGHLFQAVVTSEDVLRQKPAPDIYLEAAKRINVPPENCLGFEDTGLGLEAVRAAGMRPVDVRELLKA
jgi:HAD superfamily hydrolase (TIGR01509 family)